MSKPQALFTTTDNIYHPIFNGQCDCLEGNLASVIQVTFEPSMAINWLVFLRLQRTQEKTTYPAHRIVGAIIKKRNLTGTFICLCMLFGEFHVRFFSFYLAIPNHNYIPIVFFQQLYVFLISINISPYFTFPKRSVGFRKRSSFTIFMTVPKATVNENSRMILRKNNIRFSRVSFIVDTISESF